MQMRAAQPIEALRTLRLSGLAGLSGGRFLVLGASLGINLLTLALPIVIFQVYDRVVPNGTRDTLLLLVIGVGIALVLDALLRALRAALIAHASARFEYRVGCAALDRLLGAKLSAVEEVPEGVHLDRLGSVDALRDFYSGQPLTVAIDLPFVVLFLALIAYLAGPLALVPLALVALAALIAVMAGRWLKAALEERAAVDDRRYSFLIETLSGIHTLKALGMEAQMLRRYERLQEGSVRAVYEVNAASAAAQAVGNLFAPLAMLSVAGVGALMVLKGELTIGALAASTLLSGRTLQPLLRALGLWLQFQDIGLAQRRLNAALSLESERRSGDAPPSAVEGRIELNDVHFSYEGDRTPLFEGLNLRIEPGQAIGLMGESGCGKSTLLWLMLGLLSPTQGSVRIDGVDIEELDLSWLRRQIAYVPQHGVLFKGSVLDNLTLSGQEETIDRALDAAQLIGLDEAVARLPQGYDTPVGASAVEPLSSGLRQRIAIARALAGAPKIVLFDEANATLDAAGDAKVRELVAALKGRATLVLVSHRPSLLRLADRHFAIRAGRLEPCAAPTAGGPLAAAATAA